MVEPDRNNHPNLLQHVKNYLKLSGVSASDLYAQHIHRLDRPVSGIVLFAKQKSVLRNLSEQFAERRVKKYYTALTASAHGMPEGTLEHWHRKEKKKAVVYNDQIEFSEKAVLHYKVNEESDNRYSWDIVLETGKYHQIRAQLASIGCPVIGDTAYGSEIPFRENAIALHARRLDFTHPVTQEHLEIEAKVSF
jgi:23S rRNA-/tRNA-specific pseudouridylate synthase